MVVAFALVAGGAIVGFALHREAEQSVKGVAATQARWVERLATDGPVPRILPAVDSARLTLVEVLDGQGRTLAASEQIIDSPDDERHRGSRSDDREFGRLDEGRRNHLKLRGGPWFTESAPAVLDGKPVLVVTFTSLAEYERAIESVGRLLALAFPVLLLLVAGSTWLLVGRSLRPVERIRHEVELITAGSLNTRVDEPKTNDEIGRLAITLNDMLERLQTSVARQRRFVADASHELRTPVTNIAAALDVAQRYPDRTDWPEVGADVAAQNQRMAALIEDLLLSAKMEDQATKSPPELLELASIVAREVEGLGAVAPTIMVSDESGGAQVLGDERRVGRVVRNLVANAARHAESRVVITIFQTDDEVELRVADDGPGIALEARERIFQPFVRLDQHRARSLGGTGLGLAIVADLVSEMGGTVGVVPNEPHDIGGAVFVVHLPAAPR